MKQLKNIEKLPEDAHTLFDSNSLGESLITRQMLESWETERVKNSFEMITLHVDYHWGEEWFGFKFILSRERIPSQGDFYFKEGVFRIPVATFEDGLDLVFYFVNQWKYESNVEKYKVIDDSKLPNSLFPFRQLFHKKLAKEIKSKGCPRLTLPFLQRILLQIS